MTNLPTQTKWLPLPVVILAVLNLAFPAALIWLMGPTLYGNGTIGNWPSIIKRGIVAFIFLAAAILLVTRHVPNGIRLTVLGLVLNVLLILSFWSHSGILFTLEISGWLTVDTIIVLMLAFLPESATTHSETA